MKLCKVWNVQLLIPPGKYSQDKNLKELDICALQRVFYSIRSPPSSWVTEICLSGWWECHTQGRLYTTNCDFYLSTEAGDQTPDPLNRNAYLLRFIHLATLTGKSSTWESNWQPAVTELGLCASSYMRTQPLFHLRHSPFSNVVLVTSVNLYGYGILAFDRQVAGLSPTDGVWSL